MKTKFIRGIGFAFALALLVSVTSQFGITDAKAACDQNTSLCDDSVAPIKLTSKGHIPAAINVDASHGLWKITLSQYVHTTDPIVEAWTSRIANPEPKRWRVFPNIPNPDIPSFDVHQGIEYGEDESPFGENNPLDVVISAQEVRAISGDSSILGNTCQWNEESRRGCLRILVNVGDSTVTLRGQSVDNGFTVMGRFWDGDHLEVGIQALTSHMTANMLGYQTFAHPGEILNSGNISHPDDAGANCSRVEACSSVDVLVIVFAGNRVLATMQTVVVGNPTPTLVNTNPGKKPAVGDEIVY